MKHLHRQTGGIKVTVLIPAAMVFIVVAMLLMDGFKYAGAPNLHPMEPPDMAAASYTPHDVVGDLGGMPVTIPHHFASYVEYDDDPGI